MKIGQAVAKLRRIEMSGGGVAQFSANTFWSVTSSRCTDPSDPDVRVRVRVSPNPGGGVGLWLDSPTDSPFFSEHPGINCE